MDRGKWQSDFDNDIYENITCTEEPTKTALKMRKIQQEPKEENLSPKFLKTSEMLETQRRLLMVLGTLLVLVFTFLIVLTCLMFIYYSMVNSQLKQQDEEKANLLTQITTINQIIDNQKTQITAMQQTLDSRISESMRSTKQDILQTIQNEKTKCDSGWKAFDGSCYFIDTTERNQDDAQATCKSMNSDLVIINSDREKNFIESITDSSSFWIGLKRDKNNKKEWRWVDGTYYYPSQRFWMNGEPNNESEECVHTSKEKKWNDIFCTYKYKAICEKK
ncbi:CD209 antigen-like protein C isoform X2 [Xenopus laevis]|uniref:CD209 antigen-like protein C isoform X2 n=1 Tax=Xenopus laevis TaxID=8355 RepID=A0A8J1MPY0_XENLA|nr:CD209 antigen-like protein C isoform X2 [Xenopus laevis]